MSRSKEIKSGEEELCRDRKYIHVDPRRGERRLIGGTEIRPKTLRHSKPGAREGRARSCRAASRMVRPGRDPNATGSQRGFTLKEPHDQICIFRG